MGGDREKLSTIVRLLRRFTPRNDSGTNSGEMRDDR